ncbi:MAG TPA: hypothetical protein VM491_14895, partial [Burkholderiaceae bacterium]|nr:hypothetical protein [Burkholderiaceae bacterium]
PPLAADLGAGTGANLRYLIPLCGPQQRWRAVDHDPRLLAQLARSMRGWADRHGFVCDRDRSAPGTRAAVLLHRHDRAVRIERVAADLAQRVGDRAALAPDAVPANAGLVTASALLDLVSASWLESLIARCRELRAPVLFALCFDGTLEWEPGDDDDAAVAAAFAAHQRSDKGFGAALGAAAAQRAAELLDASGYRVAQQRSDWRLDSAHARLQQRMIDGVAVAAAEAAPEHALRFARWSARRRAALQRGESRLRVGHRDVFGSLD